MDMNIVCERRAKRFNSIKPIISFTNIAKELGWNRTTLYGFINGNTELSNERLYELSKLIDRSIEWILAYDDDSDSTDVTIVNSNKTIRKTSLKHVGESDYTSVVFKTPEGLELCQKASQLVNSDIKKVIEYIDYLEFARKTS